MMKGEDEAADVKEGATCLGEWKVERVRPSHRFIT